jgi:hypothetical protein
MRLFASLSLAFCVALSGCVPSGILPRENPAQLRTPQPVPATPSAIPTRVPLASAAPGITGRVTAPAGVLTATGALATTDGQARLPLGNSGLLLNFHLADLASGTLSVVGALVLLTDLSQRPFVDPQTGLAITGTTDAGGNYHLLGVAQAKQDAIVVAYPSASQRLTALVLKGATVVDVDLATTLTTELLRNEALLAAKAPGAYSAVDFAKLVTATRAGISDGTLGLITVATDDTGASRAATVLDLRLDQAQSLRNQYAIAINAVAPANTVVKAISDGWRALLGLRPRAVTTVLGNGRLAVVRPTGSTEDDELPGMVPADGTRVALGEPGAVATSTRGDVFLACSTAASDGGYVRWLQPDGRITSVALPFALHSPAGLVIESDKATGVPVALLVADAASNLVLRLGLNEAGTAASPIDIVAGEDLPLDSRLAEPQHPVYVDGYTSDDGNQPLTSRWRLSDEGQRHYVSNHDFVPTPARYAHLSQPGAMVKDELGNLYIADRGNQRVRMIPASAGPAFGYHQPVDLLGTGVPSNFAGAAAVLQAGAIYTIAGAPTWDPGRTPERLDGHWFGDFGGDGGPAQQAKLAGPSALAFYAGFLYVSERENQRVRRISRLTGVIETVAGMPPGPQVATRAQHDGKPTDFQFPTGTVGDGGPATRAQLAYPEGLAIDSRDPDHPRLYVADQGSGRLRVIDIASVTPTIRTLAGRVHDPADLSFPVEHDRDGEALAYADVFGTRALAVDGQGNLLVADARHRRLRKLWLQWD